MKAIGAAEVISGQSRILIKPNLVNLSPPPVTLPVDAAIGTALDLTVDESTDNTVDLAVRLELPDRRGTDKSGIRPWREGSSAQTAYAGPQTRNR